MLYSGFIQAIRPTPVGQENGSDGPMTVTLSTQIYTLPVSLSAPDKANAESRALATLAQQCPASDGWHNHIVGLKEVPLDVLRATLSGA